VSARIYLKRPQGEVRHKCYIIAALGATTISNGYLHRLKWHLRSANSSEYKPHTQRLILTKQPAILYTSGNIRPHTRSYMRDLSQSPWLIHGVAHAECPFCPPALLPESRFPRLEEGCRQQKFFMEHVGRKDSREYRDVRCLHFTLRTRARRFEAAIQTRPSLSWQGICHRATRTY
jgi:hypothetical protein